MSWLRADLERQREDFCRRVFRGCVVLIVGLVLFVVWGAHYVPPWSQ